jgi:hypothetical protein
MEVYMFDSRRYFLKSLAGFSSSLLLFQSAPPIRRPRRRTPVDPPTPAEDQNNETSSDGSESLRRAQLKEQERQFRETMLQLFNKVSDLKARLDAIHTADIFSVTIFKQAQEIEKLARRLKNYAKA